MGAIVANLKDAWVGSGRSKENSLCARCCAGRGGINRHGLVTFLAVVLG